jgi:guanylate kinase
MDLEPVEYKKHLKFSILATTRKWRHMEEIVYTFKTKRRITAIVAFVTAISH